VDDTFVDERGNNNPIQCFTPEDRPYGFSYGEWTTKWWEWALSVPIPVNPVLDNTGQYADQNQHDPVWFLAGTIGDENKVAHRTCIIPKQQAILFPVINYIHIRAPSFKTDIELANHVQKDIDDIVVNEAMIDGQKVPIFRVKSDPRIFNLRVREENKLEIPVGSTMASADGYWVFIKSLNIGRHEVYFHGACSGGIRNASARYQIITN
jgi:hypothetical protein